ncbi:hypothetical protein [Saccharicrinis sp. FJH54]|uniref:hypothetical protein n=1 Tax=Saccharicrinis sp. FJH54 TaxID=3344665 RepID=UPI0035D43519
MNTGVIIISVVLVGIWVIPVVILNRTRRKKEHKMLQAMRDFAKEQHSAITDYELYGDFSVGIDIAGHFFYYTSESNGITEVKHINLKEIKNCKVVTTRRSVVKKEGESSAVGRLDLQLIPLDRNEPFITLEFYNSDKNPQLNGEIQSIEKWSKVINKQLEH